MLTGIHSDSPELQPYYRQMNAWLNTDVLFNDNKTLIRLNAIFFCFSLGYYYVHVVFINFISFWGLTALFKLFQFYGKNKSMEIFAGVMLLPSTLFWGSGLLKDGLLLFALGMLLYSFNKIIVSRHSFTNIIAFMGSLLLLMITKLYVLITIFPGIIAWYISKHDSAAKMLVKFIACYLLYFTVIFNFGMISNKYDIIDIIYYKQKNFYVIAGTTKANSVIQISPIEPTTWSIIRHSPEAVMRVLFRPFITDSTSPLILMASLENIFLLMIMLTCLLSIRKRVANRVPEIFNRPLFYFSVFFVVLMFSLIGLITPILGAMVRYKVPALPFLMFIFISLYDRETFIRRFGFLLPKRLHNQQ